MVALLLASGLGAPARAQGDATAGVDVRIWQGVNNATNLHISARAVGGSWFPLGTVPLVPEEGGDADGRLRYRSITVAVPLPEAAREGATARVDVRVEQGVADPGSIFVSVRGEGYGWSSTETIALPLDELHGDGHYRYGDVTIQVPLSLPSERHLELKRFMLELINAARADAGLDPVELGDNDAAQLHAEASLEGCFLSHWGLDGLKPTMRYTLVGGQQSNQENARGLSYCYTDADRVPEIENLEDKIREAMDGWRASAGHLAAILGRSYKRVNVGIAWDRYNFAAIQQFEGDYVAYERTPAIKDGLLTFGGSTRNGVTYGETSTLSVQVYYDAPPRALTQGQLARTHCSDRGLPVAALRRPPSPGAFYRTEEFTRTYAPCPDPAAIDAGAAPPESPDDANALLRAAREGSRERQEQSITVPWITASEWTANGETFSVTADLGGVLAEHGPGVYTVVVWGDIGEERAPISHYAIFHEVEPPDGYLEHGQ